MEKRNNLKQAGWIMFIIWTASLAVLFILANKHIIGETRERALAQAQANLNKDLEIGRASCRERV